MKFENTYKVVIEVDDTRIDELLDYCGFTREEAIEEWGSVEEWLIGWVDESVCLLIDEDDFITNRVREETGFKKVED